MEMGNLSKAFHNFLLEDKFLNFKEKKFLSHVRRFKVNYNVNNI